MTETTKATPKGSRKKIDVTRTKAFKEALAAGIEEALEKERANSEPSQTEPDYSGLSEEDQRIQAAIKADREAIQNSEIVPPIATDEEEKIKRYIRNANYSPFRIHLERHDKGKSIQLKPRGERGDFAGLQDGDLDDPNLQSNLALGVIEIITAAEALDIATKQTVNQQAAHPALSSLRNELGEEYGPDAVNVDPEPDKDSVVVADLGKSGDIRRRQPGAAPGVPEGVTGAEPGVAPANEQPVFLSQERAADAAARNKSLQGPQAGLGNIQRVVVDAPKSV